MQPRQLISISSLQDPDDLSCLLTRLKRRYSPFIFSNRPVEGFGIRFPIQSEEALGESELFRARIHFLNRLVIDCYVLVFCSDVDGT